MLIIVCRLCFLIWFMVVNTFLSGGLLFMTNIEFPSVLLFLFLVNMGMYLTFYLVMKNRAGERLTWPTFIFLLLSAAFMLPAMVFFRKEVKNTDIGAALSKELNQPCLEGLNFFDNHDIWHFLSRYTKNSKRISFQILFSFGLFFALCFLLTLDDDLIEQDQTNIQVW